VFDQQVVGKMNYLLEVEVEIDLIELELVAVVVVVVVVTIVVEDNYLFLFVDNLLEFVLDNAHWYQLENN
jgi:hypothetical protein